MKYFYKYTGTLKRIGELVDLRNKIKICYILEPILEYEKMLPKLFLATHN